MRAIIGSGCDAAIAIATIAGSFLGARPERLISTINATVRAASRAKHASTTLLFSIVSFRSLA